MRQRRDLVHEHDWLVLVWLRGGLCGAGEWRFVRGRQRVPDGEHLRRWEHGLHEHGGLVRVCVRTGLHCACERRHLRRHQ